HVAAHAEAKPHPNVLANPYQESETGRSAPPAILCSQATHRVDSRRGTWRIADLRHQTRRPRVSRKQTERLEAAHTFLQSREGNRSWHPPGLHQGNSR